MLRVGGRVVKSSLPNDSVHQYILPKANFITEMFIRKYFCETDAFAEKKFSVFPAYSFVFAEAAARVGISKHPDRLQVAAILPVEFEDETRPGIQHNPASEFWVTL